MKEFEYSLETEIKLEDGTTHNKLLLKSPSRDNRRLCQKLQAYCGKAVFAQQSQCVAMLKGLDLESKIVQENATDDDTQEKTSIKLSLFQTFLNDDQCIAATTALEDLIYNCCYLIDGSNTRIASNKDFGNKVFHKISNADLDAICDQFLEHFIAPSVTSVM